MKALRLEEVDSKELRRVQANLADFVQPLVRNPLLDGVLLEGVSLAAGTNTVAHGLGRAPRGVLPLLGNADARVWLSATPSAAPAGSVRLDASAAVTLSLFVF